MNDYENELKQVVLAIERTLVEQQRAIRSLQLVVGDLVSSVDISGDDFRRLKVEKSELKAIVVEMKNVTNEMRDAMADLRAKS